MTVFSEEFLNENDFEAVLPTFCCYDYGVKASEGMEKIATDQTRLLQILPVFYNLLHNQK